MKTIKRELQEVFEIELTITNLSKLDINMYIENSNVFKLVKGKKIDNILKSKIKKDGVLFSNIYDIIKNKSFTDYNRKINVTIRNNLEPNILDEYNIVIDKITESKINKINDKNALCMQKLETIKEVTIFFVDELLKIKKLEKTKIKNEIEKHSKNKSFFVRITQKQNNFELGHLYFSIQDYVNAKIHFLKAENCEEMVFYCNVMLDIEYADAFVYYSNDLIINIRRIYFIREYLTCINNQSLTMYYMLNSFEYNCSLLKLILETELITFLCDLPNFNNRIVLALFNCINIAHEQNLNDLCLEYINELRNKKPLQDLVVYIDELEKIINDKNSNAEKVRQ